MASSGGRRAAEPRGSGIGHAALGRVGAGPISPRCGGAEQREARAVDRGWGRDARQPGDAVRPGLGQAGRGRAGAGSASHRRLRRARPRGSARAIAAAGGGRRAGPAGRGRATPTIGSDAGLGAVRRGRVAREGGAAIQRGPRQMRALQVFATSQLGWRSSSPLEPAVYLLRGDDLGSVVGAFQLST